MSKPLPNNIFLRGIWEPLAFECDIHDPIIIGKIPKALNGMFYRNGPNPQHVYLENYHMFEGDGMIHAISFQNGHVKFPRIDERLVGQNNRYAYMNGTINENSFNLFDSIVRYDVNDNKKQVHHFGKGSFPLEPIFVPRSVDAQEGDGFLLSYVYREAINRSDLVILDAQHIDDDPVFPLEHGKQLAQCISGSHLEIIEKMGHGLPDEVCEKIVDLMTKHFKQQNVRRYFL